MKEKLSLEMRVRLASEGKGLLPKYNLGQFKDKKKKHVEICKKLLSLSESNGNFPITVLVYFAIDKSAHKSSVFDECYTSINMDKAKTILSWLKSFASHNRNGKLFRNANVAHVLTKYYDKVSKDTEDFEKVLSKSKPNPHFNSFKEIATALKMEEKPKVIVTKAKAKKSAVETKKSKKSVVETKKSKKSVVEEAMAKACAE